MSVQLKWTLNAIKNWMIYTFDCLIKKDENKGIMKHLYQRVGFC